MTITTLSEFEDHYTSVKIITDIVAILLKCVTGSYDYYKKVCKQVGVKKFVPNKKGYIRMEVYYLCQPNTYVIAIAAANPIHEQ